MILDALVIATGNRYFFNQIFSIFEVAWFLASVISTYFDRRNKRGFSVSLHYIWYYLITWFVGSYWLIANGDLRSFPMWFIAFTVVFGGFYTVKCFIEYRKI